MDAFTLEFTRSLDTFPSRSDLDQDAVLLDTDGVVEGDELLGLGLGTLLVKGETGVDLGRDTSRDDGEDGLAEFDELQKDADTLSERYCIVSTEFTYQAVSGSVNLAFEVSTLALAVLDGSIDQTLVCGLVSSRENERGVSGRILGLVDIDSCIENCYKAVSRPQAICRNLHSKSPESETTTVPVCLRALRALVILDVVGSGQETGRASWSQECVLYCRGELGK